MSVYLTVTNTETAAPIKNLSADNFLLTTADNLRFDAFNVETDTATDRPVHLMMVLDLTSSVSAQEFTNMQTAAALLAASLDVHDQVGLVTMDHASTTLLQPLSPDHNATINAMYSGEIAPVVNQNGNVVADGIYQAIEALVTPAPDVRPTVVVFTDVPSGGVGGEHDLGEIRALAAERGTTIDIIYFEAEADAQPTGSPPDELAALADETGGLMLRRDGEVNPDDDEDYNDDVQLPEMAQQIADLLEYEYRLHMVMPFAADDGEHLLTVVATALGQVTPAVETTFRARTGLVSLVFSNVQDGQHITLPLTLQIDTAGSSNTLRSIFLYQIDNATGTALQIAEIMPELTSFTLVPESFATGVLTLKVAGQDAVGNSGEKYLTLIVQNGQLGNTALPAGSTINKTRASDESRGTSDLVRVALWMVAAGVVGSIASLAALMVFRRRNRWANAKTQPMPVLPPPIFPIVTPINRLANPVVLQIEPPVEAEATQPVTPIIIAQTSNGPLDEQTQIIESHTPAEPVIRGFLLGSNAEKFSLFEGENTIGRHSTNMIQIQDATASRHHAVIEVFGDSFEYLDWQASHPSLINGHPLPSGERVALKHNDVVQLGSTVLRFILPQ